MRQVLLETMHDSAWTPDARMCHEPMHTRPSPACTSAHSILCALVPPAHQHLGQRDALHLPALACFKARRHALVYLQARSAFCAVRPPGHHAGPVGVVPSANDPHGSHGFCLLSNVAIGAAYAMNVYRRQGGCVGSWYRCTDNLFLGGEDGGSSVAM